MRPTELAKAQGIWLCTAESITAGALGAELAKTPGASGSFLGGVISYQDQVKSQLLGVSPMLIENQTAVDPEVAAQMADGARSRFARANVLDSDKVLAISTTGVAGPESVGNHEPGVVYIALASRLGVKVYAEQFHGSREEIVNATVERSILLIGEELQALQG